MLQRDLFDARLLCKKTKTYRQSYPQDLKLTQRSRILTTLRQEQYLELLGIPQWQQRVSVSIPQLTYVSIIAQAQWLFILDKSELDLDSPLLLAIVNAIGQTKESVNFAYYAETSAPTAAAPDPRYIVAMGASRELLRATQHLYDENTTFIFSDSLAVLTEDITAKRQLWQQLKPYRT